jgi:hypothetical protein
LIESTGASGDSYSGSFYIFFPAPDGISPTIRSLNSSFNSAYSSGSGLYFRGLGLSMQYCVFDSNSYRGLLVFQLNASDTFNCIEFFNNRASNDALLNIDGRCSFVDCVFAGNEIRVLVSGKISSGVLLLRCVFDQWQLWVDSVTLITEVCEVRDPGAITLNHGHCPQDFHDMSTGTKIAIGVSVSVVGLALIIGGVVFCWKKEKLCFGQHGESELRSSRVYQG